MRTLVCVKRVPAPGARINLTADEQAIDTTQLGFTMSPHEECAVEEAVQISERLGGETTVLTLGPAEAEEQLRYSVSLGIQRAVLIPTDGSPWDPQRTATAITQTVQALEEADGPFDLILFGNESADSGGFQVGVRVAHALARPIVNGIKGIEVEDGEEGRSGGGRMGIVKARRETDEGVEIYELELPAVLGVKEGLNLPRYPTMKGRLASKKADITSVGQVAAPGGQAQLRLAPPPEEVSETIIFDTGPEAAPKVVDLLEEIGVL